MQVLEHLHYKIKFQSCIKNTSIPMAIALDAAMRNEATKIGTLSCLRVDPTIIWPKSSLIIIMPTPYIYILNSFNSPIDL